MNLALAIKLLDAANLGESLGLLQPPVAAVVILGLSSTAQLQRIARGSLLDVLGQPHITTAPKA
jgi:ABC-type dipeptide/oligopeptide/nickel transport system permease component